MKGDIGAQEIWFIHQQEFVPPVSLLFIVVER